MDVDGEADGTKLTKSAGVLAVQPQSYTENYGEILAYHRKSPGYQRT